MFQYEKQGGESKGVLQWPFYFGDMQMSGYHSFKSESFHDLMGVVNAIHKDKKVIVIANELIRFRFSHKPTDFEYKREGGSTESDLATNLPYTPYEDSDLEELGRRSSDESSGGWSSDDGASSLGVGPSQGTGGTSVSDDINMTPERTRGLAAELERVDSAYKAERSQEAALSSVMDAGGGDGPSRGSSGSELAKFEKVSLLYLVSYSSLFFSYT